MSDKRRSLEMACALMSDEIEAGCSHSTLRKTWNEVQDCLRTQSLGTQAPVAWIVKHATRHDLENVNVYLREEDARRAASNAKAYAHATKVSVDPLYASPPALVAQREALEKAEAAFEFIRLKLIGNLEEPERSAFWKAVEIRDALRALNATPATGGETEPPTSLSRPDSGGAA